jgi:hypothetical protein
LRNSYLDRRADSTGAAKSIELLSSPLFGADAKGQ